jgi:Leucine-rich repeat (LRR) protein
MRKNTILFIPAVALAGALVNPQQWIGENGGTSKADARGKIVEVSLRSSWIADSDLQALSTFQDLHRLDLSHTRITDLGFRELKPLTQITDLNLYYAEQIGDGALAVIRNWRNLKRLNLRGTKVTDAGVEQLAEHPALESLDVGFSLFTDGGFQALTSIPNLKELAAGGNKVTDVGLNSLRLMPNLRVLDLNGAQRTDSGLWAATVTDRGLDAIATLKQLEELYLRGAKITNTGSGKLAALQKVKVLDLGETQLSEAGLKFLSQLPELERLSLYGCKRVDDSVIPALESIRKLQWVDLTGTGLTPQAISRLRKSKPNCSILWEPVS